MGFDPKSTNFKKVLEKYHSKTWYTVQLNMAAFFALSVGFLTYDIGVMSHPTLSILFTSICTQVVSLILLGMAFRKWWIFNYHGYDLLVHSPSLVVQIIYRNRRGHIEHDFGHLELKGSPKDAPTLIFPLGNHWAAHVPPATNYLYGSYDPKKELHCFTLEEEGFKFNGTLVELVTLVQYYPYLKSADSIELLMEKTRLVHELQQDILDQDARLKSYEEVARLILSLTQAIEECLNGTRFHASEEGRKLIEAQMRALEQILKALPTESSNSQALDMRLTRLREILSKKSPANRLANSTTSGN